VRSGRGPLALAGAAAAIAIAQSAAAQEGTTPQTLVFGRSAGGRALVAEHRPGARGGPVLLVVGAIHGDETAGVGVIRALRSLEDTGGVDLWTVTSVNPDGIRLHRRQNGHGVDLNRNFSVRWRANGRRGAAEWGGSHAFSEPESRAVRRLVRRIRPDVTVWYHQPWGVVLLPCRGPAPGRTRYARLARMKVQRCRGENLPGTATAWQHREAPRAEAFVVELGPGALSAAAARRHARAALGAARAAG
jgi:protein MpaA